MKNCKINSYNISGYNIRGYSISSYHNINPSNKIIDNQSSTCLLKYMSTEDPFTVA